MQQAEPAPPERLTILFYLPVVTPWWFEQICVPLIRLCAGRHTVHVMVPPSWSGTGIGADQVPLLEQLPEVYWHLLDGADHPLLRIDASSDEELLELVRLIAPDLTLARSADIATPARFPGRVRFLMEGSAPPLLDAPRSVWFAPSLFDYGIMPVPSAAENALLDDLAASLPLASEPDLALPSREEFLAAHDLPADTRLFAVPLEYEHEENFFAPHHAFPTNAAMIEALAREVGEDAIIAVTQHPLTELHGDPSTIAPVVAAHEPRVRVLESEKTPGATTLALARHADAFVSGNSKSWANAAFFGTPLVRLSPFATGSWANAYASLAELVADLAAGRARRPDRRAARRWFAFHMLDRVIDLADETLDADAVVARAMREHDPARWHHAAERRIALARRAREAEAETEAEDGTQSEAAAA